MDKFQHPSNNSVFGAPVGWDQSELPCDALPVTITTYGGVPAIQSYWKPTYAEVNCLVNGGCIVLSVIGEGMPPVAIDVEDLT